MAPQHVEVLARVDLDGGGLVGDEVAQHALRQRQVLVQQGGGRLGLGLLDDGGPGLAQVFDVHLQVGVGGILGHGADDEAAFFFRRQQRRTLLRRRSRSASFSMR
jgi:hypothetical protein